MTWYSKKQKTPWAKTRYSIPSRRRKAIKAAQAVMNMHMLFADMQRIILGPRLSGYPGRDSPGARKSPMEELANQINSPLD